MDGKWDRELQREVRGAERDRGTKYRERQTQDRWDAQGESQVTDTQTETWGQTLRDRVRLAEIQTGEAEGALSAGPQAEAGPVEGRGVGVFEGGASWGCGGRAEACGGMGGLFFFILPPRVPLGRGGVGRGGSVGDSSTPIWFSPPALGSQTGEEKK